MHCRYAPVGVVDEAVVGWKGVSALVRTRLVAMGEDAGGYIGAAPGV